MCPPVNNCEKRKRPGEISRAKQNFIWTNFRTVRNPPARRPIVPTWVVTNALAGCCKWTRWEPPPGLWLPVDLCRIDFYSRPGCHHYAGGPLPRSRCVAEWPYRRKIPRGDCSVPPCARLYGISLSQGPGRAIGRRLPRIPFLPYQAGRYAPPTMVPHRPIFSTDHRWPRCRRPIAAPFGTGRPGGRDGNVPCAPRCAPLARPEGGYYRSDTVSCIAFSSRTQSSCAQCRSPLS